MYSCGRVAVARVSSAAAAADELLRSGVTVWRENGTTLRISVDERTTAADVATVARVLRGYLPAWEEQVALVGIPAGMVRESEFLTHPVFHSHRSETAMMRYLRRLSDKDFALDRGMIPLGSCTMKLNSAVEMAAISWPAFARIHPFAPASDLEVLKLTRMRLVRQKQP